MTVGTTERLLAEGKVVAMREVAVAVRTWVHQKTVVCDRLGKGVTLEVELVLPAEVLPDQPPRVLAHRCSDGLSCNSLDRPACQWAGTLPAYDPFG